MSKKTEAKYCLKCQKQVEPIKKTNWPLLIALFIGMMIFTELILGVRGIGSFFVEGFIVSVIYSILDGSRKPDRCPIARTKL